MEVAMADEFVNWSGSRRFYDLLFATGRGAT
jgi:hypothetical protein